MTTLILLATEERRVCIFVQQSSLYLHRIHSKILSGYLKVLDSTELCTYYDSPTQNYL